MHETKFGSASQLRTLIARRPDMRVSPSNKVPAASGFTLNMIDGPPGGGGWIALGLGKSSREAAFDLGFEQTLFWSTTLLTPIVLAPVAFDSTGAARLALRNPGFAQPLTLTTQGYAIAKGGTAAGTTPPVVLTLR